LPVAGSAHLEARANDDHKQVEVVSQLQNARDDSDRAIYVGRMAGVISVLNASIASG
jgi:hypothetical protein